MLLTTSDFPGYPGTRSRSGTRVMERVPEKICSVLKNVRLDWLMKNIEVHVQV